MFELLRKSVLISLLIATALTNLKGLPIKCVKFIPNFFVTTSSIIGSTQQWNFFAPKVNSREGYFIAEYFLENAVKQKVGWDAREIGNAQRPNLRNLFPDKRWRQHFSAIFISREPDLLNSYGFWLQKRIEARTESRVNELKIYYYLRDTQHPEDGDIKIQVYPIRFVKDRRAWFPEDHRLIKFEKELNQLQN